MAEQATEQKTQIAYVPYKTFKNAIEQLEQHGLPNRIDRTLWPSFSGVIQAQLLSAFRFFGLIKADGTPTQKLELIVNDTVNRKALLRKMLHDAYPALIAVDLTKATSGQFNEAMRKFELSPETTRKASSFFLQAARDAELPMSKHILDKTRTVSTRKRKVRNGSGAGESNVGELKPKGKTYHGSSRTALLTSGGEVTLLINGDLLAFNMEDRQFVFGLVDALENYKTKHPVEFTPEEEGDDDA